MGKGGTKLWVVARSVHQHHRPYDIRRCDDFYDSSAKNHKSCRIHLLTGISVKFVCVMAFRFMSHDIMAAGGIYGIGEKLLPMRYAVRCQSLYEVN